MLLIEGTSGTGIGKAVASRLGAEYAEAKHKLFSDGESEVLVEENVTGKDILIVQSLYPLQDKRLVELFLLANDMKKRGAKSVGVIVPYLAYAREDKRFEGKGNAVSITTILELFNAVGITTLITVAPHKVESLSAFRGKVVVVDAITPLSRLMKGDVTSPFILAPDKSAAGLAEKAAREMGCEYSYIDKTRDKTTGQVGIANAPKERMDGKEVIILDDMISSGGTIVQAAEFARGKGAGRIIAAAAHLLMVNEAYDRMAKAGISSIYGTNSIKYEKARLVDISDAVADAIRKS